MGRNSIPKLGVWRDGKIFRFRVSIGDYPTPENGAQIVYEAETSEGKTDVLGVCYADGFQECMAAMWEAGYYKGKAAGEDDALAAVRRALRIKSK